VSAGRRPDRVAAEVAEELHFHVEGLVDELVASGWPRGAARAEALRRFGDVTRIGAQCAELDRQRLSRQRRANVMRDLIADVRHGLRVLRRSPGFALIAVLTLASGMGATTAIFTVIDAVLLRPLPFADPGRLYLIWERNDAQGIVQDRPSPPNFVDWREASTTFADMTALRDGSVTLTGVDRPEVLAAADVTANFLDVLGVAPLLGRGFVAGDDAAGGRHVALLSHGAWQRLYGGDRGVIGRSLILDGEPYEIVGVMPPSLRVPRPAIAVWLPFDPSNEHRQSRYLTVIGRLAPGVTAAQAEGEMRGIAERLAQLYPEANAGFVPYLVQVQDQVVGHARLILLVVFVAVGFVLLLACANVASLVLSRATAREGEIAVRAALGASGARLRAQLVAENVVLGILGGALGAGIAWGGVRLFLAWAPAAVPRGDEIAVDWRVLVFALGLSVIAGVLLGAAPAWRAARAQVTDLLREGSPRGSGGRRRELARRVLIVAEITLSLVLLVGAGLALRSLDQLRAVDPGFERRDIIAARVNLTGPNYEGGPLLQTNARKVAYFSALLERVRAVRGVEHAGITSTLPLTPAGIDFDLPYRADGMPQVPEGQAPQVDYRIASPDYFAAMGVRLLRGRPFNEADRADGLPVVLVNETFARQHWPDEDPVGKHVMLYYVQNRPWQVVGVVSDTRHRAISSAATAQLFVPLAQAELVFGYMTLVVRTSGRAPPIDALQDAAIAIDAAEPLYDFDTVETLLADATAKDRLAALVFGLFAILALVLSSAGIYGVVSYQVARRTREIGVRMALGASRARVLESVVGETALLALLGIALGLTLATLATRIASGFLFGISAHDPLTFAGVSVLLFTVAAVAALVPALRAASIAPVAALRIE
jgi:predicted permease